MGDDELHELLIQGDSTTVKTQLGDNEKVKASCVRAADLVYRAADLAYRAAHLATRQHTWQSLLASRKPRSRSVQSSPSISRRSP
eukprot:8562305-Heterocapsa_arctica.AAC.1